MGLFTGGLSYARYFVEGDVADHPREAYLSRIQHYAIRELELDDEEEEAFGWCSVESPLDTEFAIEKVFFNEYILIGLRFDRWKVPASLLNAHAIRAERYYKEEHSKEVLSRTEKKAIKENVGRDLKAKSLPSIACYDVCWNPTRREVRFWSLSNKQNEIFLELFEKTFDVSLVPVTPYTLAERAGFDENQLEVFEELEAEIFTPLTSIPE